MGRISWMDFWIYGHVVSADGEKLFITQWIDKNEGFDKNKNRKVARLNNEINGSQVIDTFFLNTRSLYPNIDISLQCERQLEKEEIRSIVGHISHCFLLDETTLSVNCQ